MKFGLSILPYLGKQEGPMRMAQPLIAVIRPARIEPPIPEREVQDIGDPQRRGRDDPVHHRAEPLIEGMLAMMMRDDGGHEQARDNPQHKPARDDGQRRQ